MGALAAAQEVSLEELVDVLPRDAIPAILKPTFGSSGWLKGSAVVLGVEIGGQARAYPLAILTWHEIVNDVVGGVPIAATYCPLCGTGIVYDRRMGDTILTFHVSGKLYRNDLVMVDEETESLWPQMLGRAAAGPLEGRPLQYLPSSTTTLGEWRAVYPDTLVLERPLCGEGIPTICGASPYQRDYSINPYAGYEDSPLTFFPRPFGDEGASLGPKEVVLGVLVDGRAKAYPYKLLRERSVVNDAMGEVELVVTFVDGAGHAFRTGGHSFTPLGTGVMGDEGGEEWDMATGRGEVGALEPLRAIPSYWFAWYDFYPETEAYGFTLPSRALGPLGRGVTLDSAHLIMALGAGTAATTGVLAGLLRRRGWMKKRLG